MENTDIRPAGPGFPNLIQRISALSTAGRVEARAGHADLAPGLWLSTDPAGQAVLAAEPDAEGFRLTLEAGDTGRWAALGMHLPRERLEGARYFLLLVRASAEGLLATTPTLRYHLNDGGSIDVAAAPLVMAGDRRESLAHMPVDSGLLARSRDCECNLFLSTDSLSARIHLLEPMVAH